MKMYLISDNVDTATGLRLAGIDGVVAHTENEIKKALEYAVNDEEIAILLITEKLAKSFPDFIKEVKLEHYKPLIVEIPDRHGNGRTKDSITKYVQDAIGVKL